MSLGLFLQLFASSCEINFTRESLGETEMRNGGASEPVNSSQTNKALWEPSSFLSPFSPRSQPQILSSRSETNFTLNTELMRKQWNGIEKTQAWFIAAKR